MGGTVDASAAATMEASSMPPRLESQLVEITLVDIGRGEGEQPTPTIAAVDGGSWLSVSGSSRSKKSV